MSRLLYGWLTSLTASLPLWLGYGLADILAEFHYRLFPSRRHAALANLATILPRSSRKDRARIVRSMMRSYNRMLFEFFRLPTWTGTSCSAGSTSKGASTWSRRSSAVMAW